MTTARMLGGTLRAGCSGSYPTAYGGSPAAIRQPQVVQGNALAEHSPHASQRWDYALLNPPFSGRIEPTEVSPALRARKTKKTELLFLALVVQQLGAGGRCAIVVPEGVLFGSTLAHKALRQAIVCEHRLEAVISLPSGTFAHAGVTSAILLFQQGRPTDAVWFYDVEAPGFGLDKRRAETPTENDLWDAVLKLWLRAGQPTCPWLDAELWARWRAFDATERSQHYAQPIAGATATDARASVGIPQFAIVELEEPKDWTCAVADLHPHHSLSGRRYRPIVEKPVEHESPAVLLRDILAIDDEIRHITLGLLHTMETLGYGRAGTEATTSASAELLHGIDRRRLQQLFATFQQLLTLPIAAQSLTDAPGAAFCEQARAQAHAVLDAPGADAEWSAQDLSGICGVFQEALQAITLLHAQEIAIHCGVPCPVCGTIGLAAVQIAGIQNTLLAATAPQRLAVQLTTGDDAQVFPVGTVVEAVARVSNLTYAALVRDDGVAREITISIGDPSPSEDDGFWEPIHPDTWAGAPG